MSPPTGLALATKTRNYQTAYPAELQQVEASDNCGRKRYLFGMR